MGNRSKKVILITGTSSGFGRDTAETLASAGHTVYASMRETNGKNRAAADSLRTLATDRKLDLRVVDLDVSKTESIRICVERVRADAGAIDVLVNNAGTLYLGVTEAFDDDQAAAQFDTNVMGVIRTTRAVLPGMRQQRRGLIINIGSVVGRLVFPFFGIYGATKFALEALTEAYRYELARLGVDVVLVQPSAFETEMFGKIQFPGDADRQGQYGDVLRFQETLVANLGAAVRAPGALKPHAVAEAIAGLIAQPAGKRPLRTIVGADFGVKQINNQTAPVQSAALAALGLSDLDQFKSAAN